MKLKNMWRFFTSPIWPALLSAFVAPGIGQIFNGEFKKGMLLLLTTFGSFYWFFKVVGERLELLVPNATQNWYDNPMDFQVPLAQLFQETPEVFILFYALIILVVIYSVTDAYLTAKQLRRRYRVGPKGKKNGSTSDPDR